MEYYPLISESYWVIAVDSVKLGDHVSKNIKAVVDTGTSVIVGPKAVINELTKALPAKPDCTKLSTYPNMEFTIGGKLYSISALDYFIVLGSGKDI